MASDDLDELAEWAAPLIRKLEPGARKQLTRELARELRRSQRERLKAQQNPDGTAFAPRKPQHWKQGAIRRKAMFARLRTARYMKAKGDRDSASVGFTGRAAKIAEVHQHGKRAKVDKNGPEYDYPTRRILGFRHRDREAIADNILEHLTRGTL